MKGVGEAQLLCGAFDASSDAGWQVCRTPAEPGERGRNTRVPRHAHWFEPREKTCAAARRLCRPSSKFGFYLHVFADPAAVIHQVRQVSWTTNSIFRCRCMLSACTPLPASSGQTALSGLSDLRGFLSSPSNGAVSVGPADGK